ncbi:hypothetical protein [Kitasatospora camelliae]|uniref:Secreted protein n=1 Tax=Kitasatospora camelliae TaxID=3156397 RepID=A0AAU8K6D7_9ACTN
MSKSTRSFARRFAAVATVTACLSVPATAFAAEADEPGDTVAQVAGCPRDGQLGVNSVCTSLSSGAVFQGKTHPDFNHTRVITYYKKTGGSEITAKLGYSAGGTTHWGPQFKQSKGSTKTKTWTITDWYYICKPTVGMLWVKDQGTFQTPVANCN